MLLGFRSEVLPSLVNGVHESLLSLNLWIRQASSFPDWVSDSEGRSAVAARGGPREIMDIQRIFVMTLYSSVFWGMGDRYKGETLLHSPHRVESPAGCCYLLAVESSTQPRFISALNREPADVTPIWMMRQAGRSLPNYREIRTRYDFMEVIAEPELMAQVTLTPFEYLELDAAVMFADIMLPLASLGVPFQIVESVGPVIESPIRTRSDVEKLRSDPVVETVPTVFEAIRLVRKELSPMVPLIGFSGAPFTLASYLIEGKPTRDFVKTKSLMLNSPDVWDALMERLTSMVIEYLKEQVAAGIQALQLFDSWVGALSHQDYVERVLPWSTKIFSETAGTVPRIHFGTGTAGILEAFASAGSDCVSVDWRVPLDRAWERIGFDKAVQGNLDPAALLGPKEVLRSKAEDVLDLADKRPGHIFNLGHGVLPDSPLDNLKFLVDAVHSYGER